MHLPRTYNHVVVVPAYNESIETVDRLRRSVPNDVLIVLVLNAKLSSTHEVWHTNALLRNHLVALGNDFDRGTYLCRHDSAASSFSIELPDVLLVDRSMESTAVPEDQGIGFIRQTGADLAQQLIQSKQVESPWIHMLDCDCQVDRRRFLEPMGVDRPGLQVFSVQMMPVVSEDTELAASMEAAYRWWVVALQLVGSPWAVHHGMPCLAVHADVYEGFPKVRWAEDMLLVQRTLRRQWPDGFVRAIRRPDAPVYVEARPSYRFHNSNGAQIEGLRAGKAVSGVQSIIFEYIGAVLTAQRAYSQGLDGMKAALHRWFRVKEDVLEHALIYFFGPAKGFDNEVAIHQVMDLEATMRAVGFFQTLLNLKPMPLRDALREATEVGWDLDFRACDSFQSFRDVLRDAEVKLCAEPVSVGG